MQSERMFYIFRKWEVIAMKRRYVLKNRKRFITVTAALAIVIITLIYTITVYGYKEVQYKTVRVHRGDTLWSIAEKYSDNSDIRKYIFEIKKVNNLPNSQIFEGDELIVPVY
jgi:hypothetical protein